MAISFDTLVENFELLSMDEKAYLVFTSHDELEVVVNYKKQDGRNWSIWYKLNENASKQTISRKHLKQVLNAFGVAEADVIKELRSILLIQAAYANEVVNQIGELLGDDQVKEVIWQTQEFMTSLRLAVVNALAESQTSPSETGKNVPTTPVRNPEEIKNLETVAAGKSRLRIIKNQ